MRILVLNANTSQFVTDKVSAQASASAAPGTEIRSVTGSFGAAIIGSRAEHAIGEHSTVALAAYHAQNCDAVVIAVSRLTMRRSGAARSIAARASPHSAVAGTGAAMGPWTASASRT